MNVPNLDFSTWAELPYPQPKPYEDAELSTQLLALVQKLRDANAPLSGRYQRCPEYGIWGFGSAEMTRHLDPVDEMRVMVSFFRDLARAVSDPQEWLDARPYSADRVATCRGYIDVGLQLALKFDGRMGVTVRSPKHGDSELIELRANQDRLHSAQRSLKLRHDPSEMPFQAQIIEVDMDRGIALSSMGLLQIQDPSVLVMCYDRIGQWCTITVDTAASVIRIKLPELLRVSAIG
ncbi:MAG: hypothetical protein GVY30_00055 [Chloroflexi bacterium]|jgi:hypothetical protein|nr:hypothetical protein [Chloroflexota bacterium]